MPGAPKARSAPRGGLRVRIGVVLGLGEGSCLGGLEVDHELESDGTWQRMADYIFSF
jgi:hypothetical protein